MKICVVGAGAIGGLLAVKFANAGEDVTVIDRGPHLEAIRRRGLKLIMADGSEHRAALDARGETDGVGEQDLVVLAVKAQTLPTVAPGVSGMTGPETMIVPVQNGLPWWYFEKHGGPFAGRRLRSLDPDGVLAESVDVDRVVGTVTFPAGEIAAPGVVRHTEGNRFPVGEPDGSRSARAQLLADTFTRAGFKSFVVEDIRAEMWLKLWGNLSFNPISALARATLVDICRYPPTRRLARTLMEEAREVAGKLGIVFRLGIDRRIAGAEAVGAHKTSMLQDVEAGRSLEIDAIVGVVSELGRLVGVPTPSVDAVRALTALLDKGVREGTA